MGTRGWTAEAFFNVTSRRVAVTPSPVIVPSTRKPVVCKEPITTEVLIKGGRVVGVRFPIVTVNESNSSKFRGSPFALTNYRKKVHTVVGGALLRVPKPALPCVIEMTRLSPGKLDSDGLQSACKAVRDAAAHWMGVDDADDRITWEYAQGRCARGTMGLELRIQRAPAKASPGSRIAVSTDSEGKAS